MLHFIKDLTDKLLDFIKDDPVRPEIPKDYRVSEGRVVAALVKEEQPEAMVCISFHDFVPVTTQQLDTVAQVPTTAVFYTIWSYKAGKGRDLIIETTVELKKRYPTIKRFVTLSPKTELARRFHLKNGAIILSENDETINYEYL